MQQFHIYKESFKWCTLKKYCEKTNMQNAFYYHFQTDITFTNLSSKYVHISLNRSYKTPVKKNLIKFVFFKIYEHFKIIYYSLYILCSNNFLHLRNYTFFLLKNYLPSRFCKLFYYNNKDKADSGFFFDAYFAHWCVDIALNNYTHSIFIINNTNRSHKCMR